jgi:2-C-methyl-D-erythritol 4-phosphate cytidylyltransferase
LGGRPLIAWSFDALSGAGCRPIIVPVDPVGEVPDGSVLGTGAHLLAVGGCRRDAVLAALDLVDRDRVVLHDAARPFAAADLVRSVVGALGEADAAVAAVPVNETLKLVEGDRVAETVARDHLWHPQTPQAYKTVVLREALEEADIDASEAEAVRAAGGRVVLVPGSSKNIRVTSVDDLELAEAIARVR